MINEASMGEAKGFTSIAVFSMYPHAIKSNNHPPLTSPINAKFHFAVRSGRFLLW